MVDKDVAQKRKLRIERRDLAKLRPEGGAEAPQGGGRVELGYLPLDLFGDELTFEVCRVVSQCLVGFRVLLPQAVAAMNGRDWEGAVGEGGLTVLLLPRQGVGGRCWRRRGRAKRQDMRAAIAIHLLRSRSHPCTFAWLEMCGKPEQRRSIQVSASLSSCWADGRGPGSREMERWVWRGSKPKCPRCTLYKRPG